MKAAHAYTLRYAIHEIDETEQTLRRHLHRAGLRLEQCGFGYRIFAGHQILIGIDRDGISLRQASDFIHRAGLLR